MKNMKFETLDALVAFLHENDVQIADLEISCGAATPDEPAEEVTTDVDAETVATESATGSDVVVLEFLSNRPEFVIDATLNESKASETNVLVVDDFDTMENVCGTGKISIDSATVWVNMCVVEGQATAYLPITINGEYRNNVPFSLVKGNSQNRVTLGRK